MSRIGKNPIAVPNGVTATIEGQDVTVKGPKGELSTTIPAPITASQEDGQIVVARPDDHRKNRSLHGLSRSLIDNMVVGVTQGYTIKMEIFGVGYRVRKRARTSSSPCYSHPVLIEAPEGVTFAWTATPSCPSRTDKQLVGQIAACIRRLRKDDPTRARASATRASRSVTGRKDG